MHLETRASLQCTVVTLSNKPQRQHHTPKAMEPVEQIDPNSYIGLAFKCLEKKRRKPTGGKPRKGSSQSKMSLNLLGTSSELSPLDDDLSDLSSELSDSLSTSSDGTGLSTSSSTSRSSSRRRRH